MIYVPGKWAYDDGDAGFRITRIYVSTHASVFNGRMNWNIPEHIATFEFQTVEAGVTTVTVLSPESDGKPFFSAKFLSTTESIPIKVNTSLTGNYFNFIQPPILARDSALPVKVGTNTWKELLLNGKTQTGAANVITGNLHGGRIGDGVGYPDVQPLLFVGARVSGVLDFPAPQVFESI